MSGVDLREQVLSSVGKLPIEPLATPEWPEIDGQLFVRGLTGDERDRWDLFGVHHRDEESGLLREDTRHYRATLVGMGLCDRDGARVFHDGYAAQVGALDTRFIDRAYWQIMRLSGMGPDGAAELEKNSPRVPGESSPTS